MKVRFWASLFSNSNHWKLQVFVKAVIKVEVAININPIYLLFWLFVFSDRKIIEQSKLYLFVSSVNDNNDMVYLISIAILFLFIAFSQIN